MTRVLLSILLLLTTTVVFAGDLIEKGDAYSAEGNWDEAIKAYEEAIKKEPESSVALSLMVVALLAAQR